MPKLLPDGPIDTLGYLETVLRRPERLEEVLASGPVEDLVPVTAVDHVVVVTSGPLVVAADLVAAVAGSTSMIPVLALGVQPLPAHVGPRSLVIALGGEPNPPQLTGAMERGAHVVRFASQEKPLVRLGAPNLAVRVLLVLEQLGLLAEVQESASAAVVQLRRRRDELAAGTGPARTLARRVGRTLPIIYGADVLGGAIAHAWKRQINQAAKVAAFAGALPDVAAAEIAGWGQHGDMTRQVFSLIELRHGHEPSNAMAGMERLEPLLDEVVHARHVVEAGGDGSLAQVLDLVFQGDLFAYHLAQELEIDPGPVAATDGMVGS